MTARTVLFIESAFSDSDHGDHLPLLADRHADGGLTLTTLDEATRIDLSADDVAALLDYAGMRPAPMAATPDPPVVTLPFITPHSAARPSTPRPRKEYVQASLAHIRSIAQDGVMPIIAQYNRTRPAESFSSGTLCHHLDCKWSDIAAQLGLALTPAQQHGATRSDPLAPTVDAQPEPTPQPVTQPIAETATPTQPPATLGSSGRSSDNGHHAVTEAAAKRAKLLDDACDALRSMSNGAGRMPSTKEYNARKPDGLPRAGELMAALGIDHWGEMAKAAHLVWLPGQRQ